MNARLVVIAVAGAAALASPARAAEPDPATHEARDCPALFGDDAARERNRARRERTLVLVWPGAGVIDLVHRGPWRAPYPIRFEGLRLLGADATPDPVAFVQLDRGATGCPAGRYALDVDDTLVGAAVLAIRDGLILLEHEGALRTLAVDGSPTPLWRLTWESPWSTWRAPAPVTPAPAPAPAKGKRRR